MNRRTLLCSALLADSSWADETRAIFVGNTAPYCYATPGGAPAGVVYDMVREIAKELPCNLNPLVAPLARAFKEVESKSPALIIPPARIPSRETMLRWVAPLIPIRLMLFAREGTRYDISSIESARNLEIGILGAPGLEEAYRSAGFNRITRLSNNEAAVRMLMHDRLPAVLTADCSVYVTLRSAGVPRTSVREGAVLSTATLWLAASKNFPDGELNRWQAAADKRNAKLSQILASYV